MSRRRRSWWSSWTAGRRCGSCPTWRGCSRRGDLLAASSCWARNTETEPARAHPLWARRCSPSSGLAPAWTGRTSRRCPCDRTGPDPRMRGASRGPSPRCEEGRPATATGVPDRVRLLDGPPALGAAPPTARHGEGGTGGWRDPGGKGDTLDVEAMKARWAVRPRSTRFRLGVGAAGPLEVDLAADGPHALVAGTTGSGKSELLQTLVCSLALENRPDEMTFVLVDYKGGAAFRGCAALPHVVGWVTDLDPHLTRRALVSLNAEVRRRERLLAGAGAADLVAYHRLRDASLAVGEGERPGQLPPLARLVIVVDEFRVLVEELPDFVPGLVRLAAVGRSLGIHLVLATQRPGGCRHGRHAREPEPAHRASCARSHGLARRHREPCRGRDRRGDPGAGLPTWCVDLPHRAPDRPGDRPSGGEGRDPRHGRHALVGSRSRSVPHGLGHRWLHREGRPPPL